MEGKGRQKKTKKMEAEDMKEIEREGKKKRREGRKE